MAKKDGFGLVGKSVTGNYRGAVMHGTVKSVAKQGKTRATTEYNVKETGHTNKEGKKMPDKKLNVTRKRYGSSLREGK